MSNAHLRDGRGDVTGSLVSLHTGERNINTLGLAFGFRSREKEMTACWETVDNGSYDILMVVDNVGEKMSSLVSLSELEKATMRLKLVNNSAVNSFF